MEAVSSRTFRATLIWSPTEQRQAPIVKMVMALAAVLAVTGCGKGENQAPVQEQIPPTTAAAAVAPSPSVTTPTAPPTLSPESTVAAMPSAMTETYRVRLSDGAGEKEFFYYADTLEELPTYICVVLAANSDPLPSGQYTNPPNAAEIVLRRADDYVARSTSDMEVRSNHTVRDTPTYIHHLAMDDATLVGLSLTHLCPEMSPTWAKIRPDVQEFAQAEAADVAEKQYNETYPMIKFDDGRYTVGHKPGMVKPGIYRVAGPLRDCYWERSTGNGSIIDNQFITYAPSGTRVTVSTGEGFTSERCGRWERVG